jgi:alkyldihydroxyacetonephosphate synthase
MIEIEIDVASLLVEVPAAMTLDALETALAARGLTLGVALEQAGSIDVGAWLAKGAPGAPSLFADPADHLVAGLLATLSNGKRLEVRPGPRRAVGPDLTALAIGTNGRFATIERVWLRVHRREATRPAMPLPEGINLDPPVRPDEARLLDAIARELSAR